MVQVSVRLIKSFYEILVEYTHRIVNTINNETKNLKLKKIKCKNLIDRKAVGYAASLRRSKYTLALQDFMINQSFFREILGYIVSVQAYSYKDLVSVQDLLFLKIKGCSEQV